MGQPRGTTILGTLILTELGVGSLPGLPGFKARLPQHYMDVGLVVFVGVEPVNLIPLLDSAAGRAELESMVGAEVKAVSVFFLELRFEIPVLLAEPSLADETVCFLESSKEEGLVQIVARVIRCPDLLPVILDKMGIHAHEQEIVPT